ncbi:MAG TPA: methylated-DNA--[protein]-cysteine S-methyltransferase [Micromonosporaceae bacterium]|nr:methylated-DNA--[protein]-cysteine S-methyltransferase [Micromonosporaceae bacterium]
MRWSAVPSPIGDLGVAVDEAGICAVSFGGVPSDGQPGDHELLGRAAGQLRAYFVGELTEFDLPLSVPRGGDFERAVWMELARIPYGDMRTYGEIASAVGGPPGLRAETDPTGARAVGAACNRNPLPIVVPCHRVVGANGRLVGFGGGLARKRHLLELEARVTLERTWR